MQRIIGIDFGTSTTYMNIKRYNGAQPDGDKFSYIPVMFNYGESSGYVATIVRENADGSFDFGEKASEPLEGSKIHTEIKMRLESSDEQERVEARRITREFFKFLHEQYAQQTANLGGAGDQEETVISYPVKWKKETAQFMLDAARDAGFQNVRGMDEAEAAVATVLCQNSGGTGLIYADKPGYLMLIDMGAGTTDLVVCRYQASANGEIAIELVTSWPHSADEPTFGGREIDKVLEQYVEDHLTKSLLPALAPQASVIATAPGQAKMWKERNVSVTLAADKQVNTCAYIGTYKTMGMLTGDFPAFGRREFESFAESGLRDYARLISGCLEKTAEADENFSALDLVILTGGHSAWYFAKEILTGTMGGWLDHPMLDAVREDPCRVVSLPNPQTTVSLGLVYSKLPFKLAKKEKPKTTVKPAEVPPPVEDCYKWDSQLVPVIKHFIQEAPAFARQNEVRNTALMEQMSRAFQLDVAEEIFYLHNWGQGSYRGIQGMVITSAGIHVNAGLNAMAARFMTWWEFLNSHFEYQNDLREEENRVVISGKGVKVSFRGDQADSIGELHDLLRERAANLQSATAPEASTKAAHPAAPIVILPADDWAQKSAQNTRRELELCCGIQAKIDNRNLSLGQRIREAEQAATSYVLVVNRIPDNVVSVRRFGTDMGSMELQQFEDMYRSEMPRQKAAKQTAQEPALPKKQPAQTFQTVENESLDAAMKRFNRQVKDAKRQQKASAKPAQPTQAGAQPGNRNYYKWDDRLLPIVKEFIQKDATLCELNDLYRTDVVAQMRISFGLPAGDEIYYALATDGFFTRRSAKGKTGIIIASSGLWELETLPLKKSNYHITWEMILNGVVDVATKDRMFEIINYRNLSYSCPRYAFGDTAVMSRLQKLLREKSVALQEGRSI